MSHLLSGFGIRVTTGHLSWAVMLILACLTYCDDILWLAVIAAVLNTAATSVSFHGRRVTGWIAAVLSWHRRREVTPLLPSGSAIVSMVLPGDGVAVRWQGEHLVSLIELVPRPFTPTVIVSGGAFTDDVVDTRVVEQLMESHAPDLEADVISAGHRVGQTAPANLVALYEQVVGPHPAPARRRTWILLRANPDAVRKSALRRGYGVDGLARYLVATTMRMADHLARSGVDARCTRSFDEFDRATAVSFEREGWSLIKGCGTFTAAYTATGGPDAWWSVRADHTITRVSVRPGTVPSAIVLLTTLTIPSTPHGFSCLHGNQRAALTGRGPTTGRHYDLPIGSAGILVGETADRHPVYLPFDDVDVGVDLGDERAFTQFATRSAAAGATVTLSRRFTAFAELIGARVGDEATVEWPTTTTYLDPRTDVPRVALRRDYVETPRHGRLPIRLVNPREESRYQLALEDAWVV